MQEQAEIFIFFIYFIQRTVRCCLPSKPAPGPIRGGSLGSTLPTLEVPGPIRPRAEECGQPQHRQGLLLQYAQCGAQRQDVEEEEAAQRRMLSNCFLDNALIEMIWKYIVKKRQINAPKSIMAGDLRIHLKYTLEKSQKMRICLLSGRKFEETFEIAQWIALEKNATNANMKNWTNATCVNLHPPGHAIWGHIWKTHRRKAKQM